jgi:hypothetical protein
MATASAAEQISATLGSEVFHGDAHALLMTAYKDLKQPIGLRIEAAKAALPYEKPRLASPNHYHRRKCTSRDAASSRESGFVRGARADEKRDRLPRIR